MFRCRRCNALVNPQARASGAPLRCFNCGETYVNALAGTAAEPDKHSYGSKASQPVATSAPDYGPPISLRERIRLKVDMPGMLLMIWGGLMSLIALLLLVMIGVATQIKLRDMLETVVGLGFFVCVYSTLGVFLFCAGHCMRRLQAYGFVFTGVILGICVGTIFCMPLTLLAVWPLIVLCDPQVKQAFHSSQA